MRRTISGIIGGVLVLGGSLPMADASLAVPTRAQAVAPRVALQAKPERTVVYAGYEITAPASWPVYRLDNDPGQCVRYDVHAIYLGRPGVNQQCPAALIGRTETVSILPAGGSQSASTLPYAPAAGRLAGVRGTVSLDAITHDIRVVPGRSAGGVTVTATYGSSPALAGQVLTSLRPAPSGAPETPALPGAGPLPGGSPGARPAPPPQPGGQQVQAPAAAPPVASVSWHGLPASWPAEVIESPSAPVKPGNGGLKLGFDTCSAPSLATMKAWRKGYATIGIYIGGVNAACYGGNLTAGWIRGAAAMGWSMLPDYVGPQAPCYGYGTTINPRRPAQEGMLVADDAIRDARALGLPAKSPVYYDMEAYNVQDSACKATVLAFLGAWIHEVDARGYVSGVYSSMNSAISDMQAAWAAGLKGFTVPQAIWYAKWDRHSELNDGAARSWPPADRSKQFIGPHNITLGGITLNIDTDLVGGPTARLPGTRHQPSWQAAEYSLMKRTARSQLVRATVPGFIS